MALSSTQFLCNEPMTLPCSSFSITFIFSPFPSSPDYAFKKYIYDICLVFSMSITTILTSATWSLRFCFPSIHFPHCGHCDLQVCLSLIFYGWKAFSNTRCCTSSFMTFLFLLDSNTLCFLHYYFLEIQKFGFVFFLWYNLFKFPGGRASLLLVVVIED